MITAARTNSPEGSHYYFPDGRACYTVIAKSTGEPRPTTLADARKLGLLPSVTTILKVLHKQGLVDWLCEQTALAVLTTPRNEGESLDAFVERVLHSERVQDEEAQKARDLGTDMHAGLEALFKGERITDELRPWIEPAYLFLKSQPESANVLVETVVVGPGYAGKVDWIGQSESRKLVVDFKTAKKLPEKGSWLEHRLQLAGYAKAIAVDSWLVETANLYISTVDCGQFRYWPNPPWQPAYNNGFAPLVQYWQWANNYVA